MKFVVRSIVCVLFFEACSVSLDLPKSAEVVCVSNDDCPPDYTCRNERCVARNNSDATAPLLVGTAVFDRTFLKQDDILSVTFVVSEALATGPTVQIDVGGHIRDLTLSSSNVATKTYTFQYTAIGDEAERRSSLVTVDLIDDARNSNRGVALGTVEFDFTPPHVALATVTILPAPTSALSRVDVAGTGAQVFVTLIADEALGEFTPALVANMGATSFPLTYETSQSTNYVAVFSTVIPAGLVDGAYVPQIVWQDMAQNVSDDDVSVATFYVRTSSPILDVDQNLVRFSRSPLGNAATENIGGVTLGAGPRFELGPQDILNSGEQGFSSAFSMNDGRPLLRIRVWNTASRNALMGTLVPDASGIFSRKILENIDTDFVWVTGIDDAGNESATVRVENAEWVASANPPAFGTSPHTASTSRFAKDYFFDERAEYGDLNRVAGSDGNVLIRNSAPAWSTTVTPFFPPGRGAAAVAYDALRRRVVLFGGSLSPGSSVSSMDDTWEWDGRTWQQIVPSGISPPPRNGAMMVFDGKRGKVVLIGGTDEFCLSDVWEWDGETWTQISYSGPGPLTCGRGAAAYHAGRQTVLLWGGESDGSSAGDLWEWDGQSWTEHPWQMTGPAARRFTSLAYDHANNRIVMQGGVAFDFATVYEDTWFWDGGWSVGPATGPGPRQGHFMGYDSENQKVVVYGGRNISAYDDAVALDAANSWQPYAASVTGEGRTSFACAYDEGAHAFVVAGGMGQFSQLLNDTWLFNDQRVRHVVGGSPGARQGHGMAFDPVGGGVVMFGGSTSPNPLASLQNTTWRYSGVSWQQVASGTPTARFGAMMTADVATPRVLLFGGATSGPSYFNDFYEWDGSAWNSLGASTPVGGRVGGGMAFDEARGILVLFGGYNGTTVGTAALRDVWEWDGVSWQDRTPAPGGPEPGPRAYFGMGYDAVAQEILVFGGCAHPHPDFGRCGDDSVDYYADLWAWTADGWTLRHDGFSTPGPSARGNVAAAFAMPEQRFSVFGGYDASNTFSEMWQWDGATWWLLNPDGVPGTRFLASLAFDSDSGQGILFGGTSASPVGDTWIWHGNPNRQPGVQLAVSTQSSGVTETQVDNLRVRALCGGQFSPYGASDVGAALYGWSRSAGASGVGAWSVLSTNSSQQAALIDWTSTSAAQSYDLMLSGLGLAAFQCRPNGGAQDADRVVPSVSATESVVAVDYLELRVRYHAP